MTEVEIQNAIKREHEKVDERFGIILKELEDSKYGDPEGYGCEFQFNAALDLAILLVKRHKRIYEHTSRKEEGTEGCKEKG